jgi:hypothetical protein
MEDKTRFVATILPSILLLSLSLSRTNYNERTGAGKKPTRVDASKVGYVRPGSSLRHGRPAFLGLSCCLSLFLADFLCHKTTHFIPHRGSSLTHDTPNESPHWGLSFDVSCVRLQRFAPFLLALSKCA